ncbi:MAG: hypothetical protein M9894_06110 [Planctomycetes bacterium]|nr:hypothetical protein [Planctomycetota bacterium]
MSGPLAPVRGTFRALVEAVAPLAASFDEGAWAEVEAQVEAALGDRRPAERAQVRLFLRGVEWLPVLRWGRRFSRLDAGRRGRVLEWLSRRRLRLVRAGAWGVRTLALLGVYGRPAAWPALGWEPRVPRA